MPRSVNRGRRSKPITLPAPIGGLNGRDGVANMEPNDAFVLDNWIPYNTTVDCRKGSAAHATGAPDAFQSLETFTGGTGSKMLGFADGEIYNVTAAGTVGASLQSGRVSNIISSAMFSNAGAQYLIGVSGADEPFSYDGTAVANLVITGVTGATTTLHGICAFKGRLYLAQAAQLGFYYLAVSAIQGAASYFDLSQVARRGGYLTGIATVSMDSAGVGPTDYIVFMTSEGEYLVYAGTDPSNSATFALVSKYYGSAPIGRKGWFQFRSDLYIICDEGIVALSQLRKDGEQESEITYLSSKLGRYLSELNQYSDVHGWCAVNYPASNLLVVNVPADTEGTFFQFVMNTTNNRWCRFRSWNGSCWALLNKRLYFGAADGRVMLADEGYNDDGQPIALDARQAPNYFDDGYGMGDADKHFHFATFVMESDGTPPLSAVLNVNFENVAPDYSGNFPVGGGAVWDVSEWDLDPWAGGSSVQNFTVPFGSLGYVASVWLRALVQDSSLKWYATRVICEKSKGIVLL